MEQAPCISQIASLLADPKRTAMLWALMDGSAVLGGTGRARRAVARVGQCASGAADQQRFVAGRGPARHTVFRMAAADVSTAIDALASTTLASAVRSAPNATAVALVAPPRCAAPGCARITLGGELAAGLYQRMMAAGWVERCDPRIDVTPKGRDSWRTWAFLPRHWRRRWRAIVPTGASSNRTWAAHWGQAVATVHAVELGQYPNDSRALLVSDTGQEEISRLAASDAP
jgi:hypothetical protein